MTQTPNIPARKEERYMIAKPGKSAFELAYDVNTVFDVVGLPTLGNSPEDVRSRALDEGLDAATVAGSDIYLVTFTKIEQTL